VQARAKYDMKDFRIVPPMIGAGQDSAREYSPMLTRYIQAALDAGRYEMTEDEELFYGEVPGLEGVWASGRTLEECRKNLSDSVED